MNSKNDWAFFSGVLVGLLLAVLFGCRKAETLAPRIACPKSDTVAEYIFEGLGTTPAFYGTTIDIFSANGSTATIIVEMEGQDGTWRPIDQYVNPDRNGRMFSYKGRWRCEKRRVRVNNYVSGRIIVSFYDQGQEWADTPDPEPTPELDARLAAFYRREGQ